MFRNPVARLVAASLAWCAPSFALAGEVRIYNMTDSTITIYWKAAGCAGTSGGRLYVCHDASVDPGYSAAYEFPGGTSARRIDATSWGKHETMFGGPSGVDVPTGDVGYLTGDDVMHAGTPDGLDKRQDVTEITVAEGSWGIWHPPIYCPEGTFLTGIEQRVESNQGDGDDTGLNAIRFACNQKPPASSEQNIDIPGWKPHAPAPCRAADIRYANYGQWGDWYTLLTNEVPRICNDGVKRFRMKIEANQGDGDDTAANNVQIACSDGTEVPQGDYGWGDWGEWAECPGGTVACGLAVRVEPELGRSGDDTALNGLKVECCPDSQIRRQECDVPPPLQNRSP